MAVGHGLHQDARSERHVAAGKDARSGGHQVVVDLERPARRDLDAVFAPPRKERSACWPMARITLSQG